MKGISFFSLVSRSGFYQPDEWFLLLECSVKELNLRSALEDEIPERMGPVQIYGIHYVGGISWGYDVLDILSDFWWGGAA